MRRTLFRPKIICMDDHLTVLFENRISGNGRLFLAAGINNSTADRKAIALARGLYCSKKIEGVSKLGYQSTI